LLVICKGCKKKIERNEAFKLTVKNRNTYYCSATEYETINIEKENKNKAIDLVFEIIGETTNTAIFKELTEIAKVHTYTKLFKFIEENMIDLDAAISGNTFVHEYAKIRYFSAIIKNQIGDFKEKIENNEVNDYVDVVEEVKYTPTKKKSFTDFIDEY
jgi:hypothetical protein